MTPKEILRVLPAPSNKTGRSAGVVALPKTGLVVEIKVVGTAGTAVGIPVAKSGVGVAGAVTTWVG